MLVLHSDVDIVDLRLEINQDIHALLFNWESETLTKLQQYCMKSIKIKIYFMINYTNF